jgi:outer membrane murein-binding lipoprotein Lpp
VWYVFGVISSEDHSNTQSRTVMSAEPDSLQNASKEQLEIEKLHLEIAEIRRWWRRPAYVQSVFSILIAFVAATGTLVAGYVNGWFDVQRGRLEIQRAQVQTDVTNLQSGRTSLGRQIAFLTAERDRLQEINKQIETRLRTINNRANQLSSEKNTCLASVKTLMNEARDNTQRAEKQVKDGQTAYQNNLAGYFATCASFGIPCGTPSSPYGGSGGGVNPYAGSGGEVNPYAGSGGGLSPHGGSGGVANPSAGEANPQLNRSKQ